MKHGDSISVDEWQKILTEKLRAVKVMTDND